MTASAADPAAPPVIIGPPGDAALTERVLAPLWGASAGWWALFLISGLGGLVFLALVGYSVVRGTGVWGNNIPIAWGFPIINFVWWIGIGHAGTFISAFLLLLNQRWRASINRVAEAMTIFALVNAGLFPVLHLGRPWFAYWLAPYPTRFGVWPQFRSALPWDMAAIATYFTVSLLFWYVGMIPDLAAARDRAPTLLRRRLYGIAALGWRGAADEWRQHETVSMLLAGIAVPLVVSVHTVVSLDFAITQLPGWHSTIFPPYFVVGALFSGMAMVLLLLIPVRRAYGFEAVITRRHFEAIAKLMLMMSWLMLYSYVIETFMGWYSGERPERYMVLTMRPAGPYAWSYWAMLACNVAAPQLFWFRRCRRSIPVLLGVGVAVFAGMWLERFVIVVTSLSRDFLPSSWGHFAPTWVDLGILFGSVSFFVCLFCLFLKLLPSVAISEVKRLAHRTADTAEAAHA